MRLPTLAAMPIRFHRSVSVGVPGLRVGTGPRGHYVQASRGGFSYRTTFGGRGAGASNPPAVRRAGLAPSTDTAGMVEVTSSDVLAMEDSAFADVLADLNGKHQQLRTAVLLPAATAVVGAITLSVSGAAALLPIVLLVAAAFGVGAWYDSFHRVAVLFYDVDDDLQARFTQVCAAFDGLAGCARAWHVEAGKAVTDLTTWKRQAGAARIVRRAPTSLGYALPPVVRANVVPPAIRVGRRTIYLLPDVALVHDATGFGAVGYAELRLAWQSALFVETDGVPRDAVVSHETWEHPNKSGGPDRRFRQNRRLPVCRYEALHLSSATGLNELLEFSREGGAAPFAAAISAMPANTVGDVGRLALAAG